MSQNVNGKQITRNSVNADVSKSDVSDAVSVQNVNESIKINKEKIGSLRKYFIDDETYTSVSTIAGLYGENKTILENWKAKNNGENGNPYHKDLMNLKALRGTIAHAKTLEPFYDGELWGEEEETAVERLENYEQYRQSFLDEDEYPWQPENIPFLRDNESPKEWSERTTPIIKQELLENCLSDVEEVVAVEQYLYSSTYNFAGQVDFVYRNSRGKLIVCDLKTSKFVFDKHKLQVSAYALAYEEVYDVNVDMLKIARASPEAYTVSESEVEVQWYTDPQDNWSSRDELQEVFCTLGEELQSAMKV